MVFYFSGTGNTRMVAQHLAEATGEMLVSMADALKGGDCRYELGQDERVGFCFPVHGWQPPAIVSEFVRKVQLSSSSHYCYVVMTCGDSIGMADRLFSGLLSEKGLAAQAVVSFLMPESYVALPFFVTDTAEREHEKIAAAEALLTDVERVVAEREGGVHRVVRGPLPWVMTHVVGRFFHRFMITDGPFRVDAAKCIGCGRCERACPVGNVVVSEGHPRWIHSSPRCTACLACYHHCPRHAISYGPFTRKKGQYYYGH